MVVAGTLSNVEDYLGSTKETGDDYDGWLPTLDTSLCVGPLNTVKFKFYEKPVGASRTLQKRTAMCENSKIQILSNDVVRRLSNCSEDLPREDLIVMIDKYAQKLVNGGFTVDQTRKILVAGIKGYRTKVNRCKKEGRKIWRTSKESMGARLRTRLTKANFL